MADKTLDFTIHVKDEGSSGMYAVSSEMPPLTGCNPTRRKARGRGSRSWSGEQQANEITEHEDVK